MTHIELGDEPTTLRLCLRGAGGGGGGAAGSGGGDGSAGEHGTDGGYAEYLVPTAGMASTLSVTVGIGGTGGAGRRAQPEESA